jgi:hypothetical protein
MHFIFELTITCAMTRSEVHPMAVSTDDDFILHHAPYVRPFCTRQLVVKHDMRWSKGNLLHPNSPSFAVVHFPDFSSMATVVLARRAVKRTRGFEIFIFGKRMWCTCFVKP